MYVGWCRRTYKFLALHEDYRVVANILWSNDIKDYFGIEPIGSDLFKTWPNEELEKYAGRCDTRLELIKKALEYVRRINPPEVDVFQLEMLAASKS
jgi:hypothetical protein